MKFPASAALLAARHACSIAPAAAQTYPAKPVRIIIPFAPAGPTDNQARWAAQQLNAALGQTFIADNRPGAGGVPGTEVVVKSPPDGYTLLAGNPGPLTIAPTRARANAVRHPARPRADRADREERELHVRAPEPARERRRRISSRSRKHARAGSTTARRAWAPSGISRPSCSRPSAGVKLNHVPYKGAAQYTVDLIAGNIELAINQFAIATPLVKQGKVRCLGVTSRRPHAAPARRADDRRAGTQRLLELQLERHARARRDAESGHRAHPRSDLESAEDARGARAISSARATSSAGSAPTNTPLSSARRRRNGRRSRRRRAYRSSSRVRFFSER